MPILKNTGHIQNNFSGFASRAPRRQHRGQEPKNGSRRQDGRRDEQRAGRTNSEPAGRAAGRQDERQDERRAGGTGCGRTGDGTNSEPAGRTTGRTAGRDAAGRQDGRQRDEMSRVRGQDSTGAWNAPPPERPFPEQQHPIPHLAGGLRRPHNNAPGHGGSGAKRWRGGRQAGGGPAQRTAGRCNKGSAAGRRGENGRHPGRLRR